MRQLVPILRRFDMVQVVKLRKVGKTPKNFHKNRLFEANKIAQEIGLEKLAETFTNAKGCHVLAKKNQTQTIRHLAPLVALKTFIMLQDWHK